MPPEDLAPLNNPIPLARNNVPVLQPSRKRPADGASSSVTTIRKRPALDSSRIKGSFTSLAERKRRQPTCSMASLRNLEDEESLESDFLGYFGTRSESHYTWGKTEVQAISATRKRGRAPRFKKGKLDDGTFALFGRRVEESAKIPNSPDRSFFLKFPLEIREKVYAKVLHYPNPILVKYDLGTVEFDNLRNHSILRVCKQISKEASNFLYRENVFRAILRNPRITYHLHESFMIDVRFLSYFRNLIIECPKDNHSMDWYEHASVSMEKLVKAKTVLKSLTFVIQPQRVGLSETACGIVSRPITFADFFWFPSRLMKAVRKVPCTQLNIIVKKTHTTVSDAVVKENDTAESDDIAEVTQATDSAKAKETVTTNRFLISVDLTYLARCAIEENDLRNPVTLLFMRAKALGVRKELDGLKMRVEEIFMDDKKAVDEGKCRLMVTGEKITDIMIIPGKIESGSIVSEQI